ncbi:SH3 domain-containing protein [Gottfriedia sp. NPDC058432]|uniref:C40 family peptidase n=1 Tax=Gottfriedia sp. NPDC058432 TaxID=3346497 RepID=UPI00365B26AC
MKSKSASTLIKLNLKGERNKKRALNSMALVGLASTLTIQIPYNTTAAAASIDSKTLQSSTLYSNNNISTYKSIGNGVHVRSGAGTSYKILGSVNKNQKLDVISLSNGWYKIKFNGATGYISASYVGKVTESNISNNNQVVTSGNYISTGNGVRIRSGAGTSYQILGSVNKNQRLDVISVSNGWYKVKFNGVIGYISASYVGKVTESNNSNNNQVVSSGNYFSTINGLRVRSGAGTSYQILGSVNKNQKLEVISLSNGWYKIKFNGVIGYVGASYVGKETDSNKTDSNKVDSSQTDSNKVDSNNSQSFDVQTLITLSKKYSGVPYIWGGETPSGFDCSGFISYVFKESGLSLPRTNVAGYWYNSSNLKTVDDFQPGDLIFFENTYTYGPSHMGIVINNNEFIHASSSSGVTISKINNSYWNQHFLGFKRFK